MSLHMHASYHYPKPPRHPTSFVEKCFALFTWTIIFRSSRYCSGQDRARMLVFSDKLQRRANKTCSQAGLLTLPCCRSSTVAASCVLYDPIVVTPIVSTTKAAGSFHMYSLAMTCPLRNRYILEASTLMSPVLRVILSLSSRSDSEDGRTCFQDPILQDSSIPSLPKTSLAWYSDYITSSPRFVSS